MSLTYTMLLNFSQVWLADWEDRRVAIKRLSRVMQMADEETMSEFVAETKFMRSIRHPNIVFFYGAGIMDNLPFLVTGFLFALIMYGLNSCSFPEYLARGSLKSILANTSIELGWSRQLQFAIDAASGMRFLHELIPPRIHRDLKSGNLLVSSSWVCLHHHHFSLGFHG